MARVDRRRGRPSTRTRTGASTSAASRRSWSAYADRPLKIGSFSAASNVTGIISDTRAISILLHRHGALSFWDFAAAAPYVDIEMAPHRPGPDAGLDYKDAIFLSPHKFIGGPGTPGVLVARRELFHNRVPERCRAAAPSPTSTRPSTLPGRHRASRGRRHAGHRRVHPGRSRLPAQGSASGWRPSAQREEALIGRAIERWQRQPGHRDPGQPGARRLSIVSFIVRHAGRATCTTTSSSRCSTTCSASRRAAAARVPAPTAIGCWASTWTRSHEFEREIARGCEGIKPGWVRVNFNYFISEAVFGYILDAVDLVATRRLAARCRSYRFEPATGLWRHRGGLAEPPLSRWTTSRTRAAACATPRIGTERQSRGWQITLQKREPSWRSSPRPSTARMPR